MGDGARGCLVHAGVLEGDESLTPTAKNLFIQDVKNELKLGSEATPVIFPCGPSFAPNPFADQLELEDETKFPDFHKNIIKGQYEKIASQLNIQGGYTILPICDPFALGFSLGIDLKANIKFPEGFVEFLIPNLPKLALDLELMPPIKLAAKLPGLLSLPSLPNFNIPSIPNPAFDFSPGLNADLQFALKLPELLLNIITSLPSLLLDLPNLPSAICKIVFDSKLFDVRPDSTIKLVAYKVLVRKITEMLLIVAVGKVVGSSPVGITGGFGAMFGYKTLNTGEDNQFDVRAKIIDYATACVDLSYGDKSVVNDTTVRELYAQRLFYTEYGDGTPKNIDKNDPTYDPRVIGKEKTLIKASELSSCGLLARACMFAGGAKYVFKYANKPLLNKSKVGYYDFFTDEYRTFNGSGICISTLVEAAKTKGALIDNEKSDLPSLKKGDLIIVYDPKVSNREHVMIVAKDYRRGSFVLETIEGGQADERNNNKPTAIRKKTYKNPNEFKSEFKNRGLFESPYSFVTTKSGKVSLSGRYVYALIDGEKLCTNSQGSDVFNPSKTIEHEIYDNNNPANDLKNGYLPEESV